MVRRELLERHSIRFDEGRTHGEDTLFVWDCMLAGGRLAFCRDRLYYYRQRRDSLIHGNDRSQAHRRALRTLREMTERSDVAKRPAVRAAFSERLRLQEKLVACDEVLQPLRRRQLRAAAAALLRNPQTLGGVISSVIRGAIVRLRRRGWATGKG